MSNNEILNIDLSIYDISDEYEVSQEQIQENALIKLLGGLQDLIYEARLNELDDEQILQSIAKELNKEFKFNEVEVYNKPMTLKELESVKVKVNNVEEFHHQRQ